MFIPYFQYSRIARQDEILWPVKLYVLYRQTEVVVFDKQRSTRSQIIQQNLYTQNSSVKVWKNHTTMPSRFRLFMQQRDGLRVAGNSEITFVMPNMGSKMLASFWWMCCHQKCVSELHRSVEISWSLAHNSYTAKTHQVIKTLVAWEYSVWFSFWYIF